MYNAVLLVYTRLLICQASFFKWTVLSNVNSASFTHCAVPYVKSIQIQRWWAAGAKERTCWVETFPPPFREGQRRFLSQISRTITENWSKPWLGVARFLKLANCTTNGKGTVQLTGAGSSISIMKSFQIKENTIYSEQETF